MTRDKYEEALIGAIRERQRLLTENSQTRAELERNLAEIETINAALVILSEFADDPEAFLRELELKPKRD